MVDERAGDVGSAVVPLLAVRIAGSSMLPTLRDGDLVLARRLADGSRLRVGDVVVLRRPDRPQLLVVKRVVRRQGEAWWVEGDNAHASDDSRVFGPVAADLVLARVLLRVWPRPGRVRRPG